MKRPLRDVAASVRQRLANVAKAGDRPAAEVLQYYATLARQIGSGVAASARASCAYAGVAAAANSVKAHQAPFHCMSMSSSLSKWLQTV